MKIHDFRHLCTRHILIFTLVGILALSVTGIIVPGIGRADDIEDELEETATRVEEASKAYEEATDKLNTIQEQIDETEDRLAEIEAKLPEQREQAADSIRNLYKLQQSQRGLLDIVLSSEDFNSFIATLQYLNVISEQQYNDVVELTNLEDELTETESQLKAEYALAESARVDAKEALSAAKTTRGEAEELAAEQAAAEEEAREQALAEAAAAAEAQETFTTTSGNTVSVEESGEAGSATMDYDDVDAADDSKDSSDDSDKKDDSDSKDSSDDSDKKDDSDSKDSSDDSKKKDDSDSKSDTDDDDTSTDTDSDKSTDTDDDDKSTDDDSKSDADSDDDDETSDDDNSVDAWADRIDAYLEGSPLEGYGRTFAKAALLYGVDPRWSPAISCIESGKGRHCFKSYNAWGWGSSSWSSWKEAIYAHVAGLASGYGYTISVWAAKKYCPPNWSYWYSSVSSEMNSI